MDDIVTRLHVIAWGANKGEEYADVCRLAAQELVNLRRWKAEAIGVIENWEAVFDALIAPKSVDLGVSKSVLVAKEIIMLRCDNGELRTRIEELEARRG